MPSGYITPREVICDGCQEPFMATGTRSKFCTRKCMDAKIWRDKHPKETKCKECGAVVDKKYSRAFCSDVCKNKWYSHKTENGKHWYLLNRYNITLEKYYEILESQDGLCAICHSQSGEWHLDHDHTCCQEKARSCGKCIRGILCSNCNNGLGRFKDSKETLLSAIEYLDRKYVVV